MLSKTASLFLIAALTISSLTNIALGLTVFRLTSEKDMAVALNEAKTYGSATIGKPRPVIPTVVISPAAPPIHVLVPMPKPKPAVAVQHRKHKVHKHRKHKHHVVRVKPQVEQPVAPEVKAPVKKLVKKVPKFNCAQLPSWITSISESTIRTGGQARGYSAATLDKVLACRKSMGGT